MNKTVKTSAWICVVLGLLGAAVDVGVYVRVRSFIAQHQAAIDSGELPAFKDRNNDTDNDRDTDRDELRPAPFDRDGQFQRGGMMEGGRGYNTFPNTRGGIPGEMRGGGLTHGGFVLPFLFLAGGPVLLVIGAVMLIVNREPKVKTESEKKEKSKKK